METSATYYSREECSDEFLAKMKKWGLISKKEEDLKSEFLPNYLNYHGTAHARPMYAFACVDRSWS